MIQDRIKAKKLIIPCSPNMLKTARKKKMGS